MLGIAHRPIAVTDVLCFGPPDTPPASVPEGALHPLRIREGVIDGVADYGNKIGLPTVAGAVLYDPGFTTNPLVFAGCVGTARGWRQHDGPFPGDRVVVLGGRTGRDGIRGATFSSLTMDATTGEVAGASVQIGDPVVEKLLIDVLTGAEHLYTAITDCGAGGLSSAVGEMAEGVGADVELDRVPLKYAGLEPWEVWLSEAQERMVVAVHPERLPELAERCEYYGVELADIGHFTGDGVLVVRSRGRGGARARHGVPARRAAAAADDGGACRRPTAITRRQRVVDDPASTLLRLLAHRNIASKASTIHRYDHEILGSTVVRPLVGRLGDAPADGVVLAEPTAPDGIAIGIGVNPWYGVHDPERMAYAAVDEAIRNVVAVGADPDRVALLDNFSWGDPRRASTLGELVAAVDGCVAAATAYRAPFVSGKDSLNNEYTGADGLRHAVPPTLVITAVAHVPDADRCVTPVLQRAGDVVAAARHHPTRVRRIASRPRARRSRSSRASCRRPIPARPSATAACTGRSARGWCGRATTSARAGWPWRLAEMCIAGRLGITVTALPHPDLATALFAESQGRLVVEVAPRDLDRFREMLGDDVHVIGAVTEDDDLVAAGRAGVRRDRAGGRLQPDRLPRAAGHERAARARHRRPRHQPRPRSCARSAARGSRPGDRARQRARRRPEAARRRPPRRHRRRLLLRRRARRRAHAGAGPDGRAGRGACRSTSPPDAR